MGCVRKKILFYAEKSFKKNRFIRDRTSCKAMGCLNGKPKAEEAVAEDAGSMQQNPLAAKTGAPRGKRGSMATKAAPTNEAAKQDRKGSASRKKRGSLAAEDMDIPTISPLTKGAGDPPASLSLMESPRTSMDMKKNENSALGRSMDEMLAEMASPSIEEDSPAPASAPEPKEKKTAPAPKPAPVADAGKSKPSKSGDRKINNMNAFNSGQFKKGKRKSMAASRRMSQGRRNSSIELDDSMRTMGRESEDIPGATVMEKQAAKLETEVSEKNRNAEEVEAEENAMREAEEEAERYAEEQAAREREEEEQKEAEAEKVKQKEKDEKEKEEEEAAAKKQKAKATTSDSDEDEDSSSSSDGNDEDEEGEEEESEGEAPMGMEEDWWAGDSVSKEEEQSVAAAAERTAPMDASVFGGMGSMRSGTSPKSGADVLAKRPSLKVLVLN
jgi:hypothetical protein